jgi:hypothetical protein
MNVTEKHLNSWDDNCVRTGVAAIEEIDVNEVTGIDLREFPFDFIIQMKKKTKDSASEPVERGKYYGQVKKFAKATIPDYVEYLKTITHSNLHMGDTSEKVYKFIGKQGAVLSEISTGPHQHGYKTYDIFKSYPKDYKSGLRKWFQVNVEYNLINETIYQCTINDLNKFAKLIDADNYKTWFLNVWSQDKTPEEFRRNVWSSFNAANLSKIGGTGKKADIVEYAITENKPFCFKDIFTCNESEWKDLSVKFAYLEKSEIY